MNTEIKNKFYDEVKLKKGRITKARRAMIEMLDNKHLTFREITDSMLSKGYLNISTIYNNIEFLINEKVVVELFIGGEKYYELALTNPNHDCNNHIHLIEKKGIDKEITDIKEIYAPEILNYIKRYDELRGIDIKSIKIVIEGKEKP